MAAAEEEGNGEPRSRPPAVHARVVPVRVAPTRRPDVHRHATTLPRQRPAERGGMQMVLADRDVERAPVDVRLRETRWSRTTMLTGIAFAVCIVAGMVLAGSTPDNNCKSYA